MMVSGKVLLPPRPNAATLVVTKDRRIGLGTWGATGAIPDDLASLRQNLDPLVEDGKLMPSGRTQWGFQLAGTSLFTMRSGICTSAGGHLYYLWGEELSGQTLARAMLQAGCTYGMHLDMNLHHTAFVFASVRNIATKDYDAKILTPVMEVMPERYLEWAPKDFFYLMLRDPRPPFDEVDLAPDGGTQPAPAFIGAVWKGAVSRAVELTVFDPERIGWRLRVAAPREGGKPDKDFVTEPLPDEEAARVLCAVGVGNPGKGALLRASAVVTVDAGSHLVFTEPEQAGATENVALPYVLLGGKPTPAALDRQPVRRRASLCIADNGHVVLASSVAECEQSNAEALAKMGCSRAVALDLGAHLPWSIDRAGTAEPPLTHYGQSVLYALGQPMPPKTFRYGAVGK
jgi:hypothetical protein